MNHQSFKACFESGGKDLQADGLPPVPAICLDPDTANQVAALLATPEEAAAMQNAAEAEYADFEKNGFRKKDEAKGTSSHHPQTGAYIKCTN